MYIDVSILSVLAVCEKCEWRETRATPAAAWTALAKHVKKVHGDPAAVGRVQAAASMARKRAATSNDI